MAGRIRTALEHVGVLPTAQFAEGEASKRFRRGGPGVGNVSSNDAIIETMAGEDIADGPAMAIGPWIGRRNLIADTCATLPLQVLDRVTREPVSTPPPWATDMPVGWQDAFDFKWRIFDGLARRGAAVLRINELVNDRMPGRMYSLPMRWCRLNFMDRPEGVEFMTDERATVIYSPPQRNQQSRRVLYEWFSKGDPIAKSEGYNDKLVGIIRMRDDGTLGGENPTQQAAEVLGLYLAALREAGLRFMAPGTGTILMPKQDTRGWEGMDEWVDDFTAAQTDPLNRNQPGFSDTTIDKVDLRPPPNQMQTLEYLQSALEMIAGIDNMPPMFLGKHGANYGTSVLLMRNLLYALVLFRYLDRAETWLTARCLPDEWIAKFDLSKFLRGSEVELWAALGRAIRDGLLTPNDARDEIHKPHVDGGDQLTPGKKTKGERGDGTEERRAQKGNDESTADDTTAKVARLEQDLAALLDKLGHS